MSNWAETEWVPVEVLQRALEDSGLSVCEVARRMGWVSPNSARVSRALGLTEGRGRSLQVKTRYKRAVELLEAMDQDPTDYGL